jgi:chromate transport protein ChrA
VIPLQLDSITWLPSLRAVVSSGVIQVAVVVVLAAMATVLWKRSDDQSRYRIVVGYAAGVLLVILGIPLVFGYVGAIFPLVIGVAVLLRTNRRRLRRQANNYESASGMAGRSA